MTIRILTWNLQGRAGPDLDAVTASILAAGADLVVLQEVQRRQARALAERLGWSHAWRWKHWPIVVPAEGLAVLAPSAIDGVERRVLASRWRFWSWKRRIALAATVAGLRLVDVHLGAGVDDAERVRQAGLVVGASLRPDVVAGDFNVRPGSPVLEIFRRSGLRDAWAEARPGEEGPTNWRAGPRDGPPVQRLDHVLVVRDLVVADAAVPRFGSAGFERYGELSDHLPVTVTVDRAPPGRDGRPSPARPGR